MKNSGYGSTTEEENLGYSDDTSSDKDKEIVTENHQSTINKSDQVEDRPTKDIKQAEEHFG